jgi:hypothetical protein
LDFISVFIRCSPFLSSEFPFLFREAADATRVGLPVTSGTTI